MSEFILEMFLLMSKAFIQGIMEALPTCLVALAIFILLIIILSKPWEYKNCHAWLKSFDKD